MTEQTLSVAIESLLVAENPRNMQLARGALAPGYIARAAEHLRDLSGSVIIGTGFPVTGTFETDGPVGAIALYQCLEALGASPMIACGPPLADSLAGEFAVLELRARDIATARREAIAELTRLAPAAVVSIERPGLAADGRYYNMRREDISERCFFFDPYLDEADCPTIGIGDGGNEIGMGNISAELAALDIHPSITRCDELVVADVSNWGAYGLIAMLATWADTDLLGHIAPLSILNYLSGKGSVDGVTGENTLTEDGMGPDKGLKIIGELRRLTGFTG